MTKRDRQRLAYALEGGDPAITHQPFVWTVKAGDEYAFFWNERTSDLYSFAMNSPALPLYRSPQPTLTDEERFVLREVRDIYADEDDAKCNEIAAVLDGLLERTK
jgi:hypothetical protein